MALASVGVMSSPSLGEEGGEEPVSPDECVMQGRLKNSGPLSNLDRATEVKRK